MPRLALATKKEEASLLLFPPVVGAPGPDGSDCLYLLVTSSRSAEQSFGASESAVNKHDADTGPFFFVLICKPILPNLSPNGSVGKPHSSVVVPQFSGYNEKDVVPSLP